MGVTQTQTINVKDWIGKVYVGDCLDWLPTLEENSIDSCVTDPPYGLLFMAKDWDRGVPGVHFWEGAYRVLKPGAHLLAFGGTRMYHRLVCAIEDAGFEVRDTITWLYGSGFPKSLDVSKAIDKSGRPNGHFDEVRAWIRGMVKARGLRYRDIDAALGNVNSHKASHYLDNSQPQIPTPRDWLVLKELLGIDDDICRPPQFLEYEREVVGSRKVQRGVAFTSDGPAELPVTVAATPEAAQWSGWGTALKPACELICVARKPLSENTVAANVLKWGMGAINVDGCRIPHNEECRMLPDQHGDAPGNFYAQGDRHGETLELKPSGRWPANLVLDEESAAVLDEAVGERVHSAGHARPQQYGGDYQGGDGWGNIGIGQKGFRVGDTGGPSRFFYTAKVSRSEAEAGLLGHIPCATCGGLDTETHLNAKGQEVKCVRNAHPTKKPIALMRWLCRLVTPPGGTVLDPFAGSGSTLIAAGLEGFRNLGCEKEEEYAEIATARLAHWMDQGVLL